MSYRFEVTPPNDGEMSCEFAVLRGESVCVSGHVRWDGCVNWQTGKHYEHFCGPEEVIELAGTIIAAAREATSLMEHLGAEGEW